jgi:amidase
MTDLASIDGCATAKLVRDGEVSPTEVIDEAIARIESVNPQLNAVVHERFDRARTEAVERSLPDGPFRGVPLLLTDACPSAGDPYTYGARFLREAGYVADHDAYVTAKLRAAGFVIVGRTNMPELGLSITTEPLAFGPARNPWNLGCSTGGSSGGSAASVAAGLVPVAQGNDGGGSIRIPAAHCGVVGLKPSRGRVSYGPDQLDYSGFGSGHAITRSVRDSATVLDCLEGWMPGDPYTAPPPPRPFAAEVGASPGRLRVGLLERPPLEDAPADPDCAAAVKAIGQVLASLGHDVEQSYPLALEAPDFIEHYSILVCVEVVALLDEFSSLLGRTVRDDELEPNNQVVPALGRAATPAQYLASRRWMDRLTRRIAAWWADDGFDVLVSPVLNGPPPPIGWLTDPTDGYRRLLSTLQYTTQFNATGQPALSLPLHWTSKGLPIGVQFVAAYGREDVLIRLGTQLEQTQPWDQRRPPVHG